MLFQTEHHLSDCANFAYHQNGLNYERECTDLAKPVLAKP